VKQKEKRKKEEIFFHKKGFYTSELGHHPDNEFKNQIPVIAKIKKAAHKPGAASHDQHQLF
jgi:hypothetical protein